MRSLMAKSDMNVCVRLSVCEFVGNNLPMFGTFRTDYSEQTHIFEQRGSNLKLALPIVGS